MRPDLPLTDAYVVVGWDPDRNGVIDDPGVLARGPIGFYPLYVPVPSGIGNNPLVVFVCAASTGGFESSGSGPTANLGPGSIVFTDYNGNGVPITPDGHTFVLAGSSEGVFDLQEAMNTISPVTEQIPYGNVDGYENPLDSSLWVAGPCPPPYYNYTNVANGEAVLAFKPLDPPGKTENFEFILTYRSQLSYDGPCGWGWNHAYDQRIFPDVPLSLNNPLTGAPLIPTRNVRRLDGRGRMDLFVFDQVVGGVTTYKTPRGLHCTLKKNADGSYVEEGPHGRKLNFDASGYLVSIVDRWGNTISFSYTAFGSGKLLTGAVDQAGLTYILAYNSLGRLTSITDSAGRTASFTYNLLGQLETITSPPTTVGRLQYPQGRTCRFAYTPVTTRFVNKVDPLENKLLAVIDPRLIVRMALTYGPDGKVLREVFGGAGSHEFTYGGAPFVPLVDQTFVSSTTAHQEQMLKSLVITKQATMKDRNGNLTQWLIHNDVPVAKIEYANRRVHPEAPPALVTLYAHTWEGARTWQVNPKGNALYWKYDAFNPDPKARGNLLEFRRVALPPEFLARDFAQVPLGLVDTLLDDSLSLITRYTYTTYNLVSTVTDPRGLTWTYGYDGSGGLTSMARPDGATETFGVNVFGQRTSHTVGGKTTSYGYEGHGWLSSVTTAAGSTGYGYNGFGAVTSITTPNGNTTGFVVDEEGNVVQMNLPIGASVFYWYDGNNNLIRVDEEAKDQNGAFENLFASGSSSVFQTLWENATRGAVTLAPVNDQGEKSSYFFYGECRHPVLVLEETGVIHGVDTPPVNVPYSSTLPARGEVLDAVYAATNGQVDLRPFKNPQGGIGVPAQSLPLAPFPVSLIDNLAETYNVTLFAYDLNKNPILKIDPMGTAHFNTYDERDLLVTSTEGAFSPDAAVTQYAHDPNGNLTRVVRPKGGVYLQAHDPFDRPIASVDPLGNSVVSLLDKNGNALSRRVLGPDSGLLASSSWIYDALNRPSSRTDLLWSNPASLAADTVLAAALGAPDLGRTEGLGPEVLAHPVTTSYAWNADHTLQKVTDPLNRDTTFGYDGARRMTRRTAADTSHRDWAYDASSNVTAVSDTESGIEYTVMRAAYDALERPTFQGDATAGTTLAYDSLGNVRSIVDNAGLTTTITVNGLNREVKRVINSGNSPTPIEILSLWDRNRRLVAKWDGNRNMTAWAYNARNLPIAQVLADGSAYVFGYDPNNNVASIKDPNGSAVTQTYDPRDLLIGRAITPGVSVGGTREEIYAYDGLRRLILAQDEDSVVKREYDTLSRPIRETQNGFTLTNVFDDAGNRTGLVYPDPVPGFWLGQGFNSVDDVTAISVKNPGILAKASELAAALPASPKQIAAFAYAGPGRVSQRDTDSYLRAGGVKAVTYDAARRISAINHDVTPAAMTTTAFSLDFSYGYNATHHLTSMSRSEAITDGTYGNSSHAATWAYGYDPQYRLNSADASAASGWQDELINHDPGGNRINLDRGAGTEQIHYTSNQVNAYVAIDHWAPGQLPFTGVNQPGLGPVDTVRYAYDPNGNLLAGGGVDRMQPELLVTQTTDLPQATQFAYQYDYRNRLIAAQRTDQQGKTVTAGTYLYDALGRRISKLTSLGTQVFLYDGDRVIEEIEPSRGDVLARYVYGEEHIDNVLMMIKDADQDALITLVSADTIGGAPGPEVYVYHEDAQGSISVITGEVDNLGNGTKSLFVESCRYDAFGNPRIVDYLPPGDALTRKVVGIAGPLPDPGTLVSINRLRSAIGNRHLYTGREMDYETGNQDFRRRTYDPRMGRFLQSDPIGIWGDPLNYGNGYSYCGNDPGSWVDPWGLDPVKDKLLKRQAKDRQLLKDLKYAKKRSLGENPVSLARANAYQKKLEKDIADIDDFLAYRSNTYQIDINARAYVDPSAPIANAAVGTGDTLLASGIAVVGGTYLGYAIVEWVADWFAPNVASMQGPAAAPDPCPKPGIQTEEVFTPGEGEFGPTPATPSGMNVGNFGRNVMRWGSRSEEARARMATLTTQELQNAGVTPDMARAWRDFYMNVENVTPANPSAAGRVDLMQRAFELLGGK